MKYTSLIRKSLLTGASACLLATSAHAQFNPARGNLLLGIKENPAGSFDIVVDLGSYTGFLSGTDPILLGGASASETYAGEASASSSQNRFSNSDVLATFTDLNNLQLSVSGVNPSVPENSNLLLSRARTSLNTQSVPWNAQSETSQGTTGNKYDTIRQNAIAQGADFSNTSTKEDTSASGSFKGQTLTGGGFSGYTAMGAGTGTFGSSSLIRLDLYNIPFGQTAPTSDEPGDYLGFFEYQGDGDLWFVPENFTPVPEPSTYGVIAGAGLLAMALRRKLTAKNA